MREKPTGTGCKEFSPENGQIIAAFTKVKLPFGWLGNMAPYPIQYEGVIWQTAEALFQALRFPEKHPARERIRAEKSPMSAKMMAKKHRGERIIEPHSQADLEIMGKVVRMKLEQNLERPDFGAHWKRLLHMGCVFIIEDSSLRPSASGLFWGACRSAARPPCWRGDNHLGQIWMAIVADYRTPRG